MVEVFGDAWTVANSFNGLCILTNGIVKNDGSLVMGAGIALDCAQRYPQIPKLLGSYVKQYGNRVFNLGQDSTTGIRLISFPTKYDYRFKSDLALIKQSAIQLKELADKNGFTHILLPRPGCGKGGLDWDYVKSELNSILDDRFFVISNNPSLIASLTPTVNNAIILEKEVSNLENMNIPIVVPHENILNEIQSLSNTNNNNESNSIDLPIVDNTSTIKIKTMCVTGPIPKDLWGYDDNSKYQQLQNKLYHCINQFYNMFDVRRCLSSGEQGVDQLFAIVAQYIADNEHKDLINEINVPFTGQESKWLETGKFSKEAYNYILNKATRVTILRKDITPNSDYGLIVKAMYERNHYMVDNSDYVLGVYSGDIFDIKLNDNKRSGTLECLQYAYKKNKPIVIIEPFSLKATRINF